MKYIKASILAIALISTTCSNAQFIKDFRLEADKYYDKGDWQTAASLYEKFLSEKKLSRGETDNYLPYANEPTAPKKGTAIKPIEAPKKVSIKLINYRIAECYRKLSNYKAAEPWFEKVVSTDKASYPTSQYNYAVCLRALNKYDDAEKQLQNFVDTYTIDDDIKKTAIKELANLKFIKAELKNPQQKLYEVKKLPENINTAGGHGQNTAPFVSNKNLYFSSSRVDTVVTKKAKTLKYQNRLFTVNNNQAQPVNFPSEKAFHQSSFTFSPDGNTVYFTKWELEDMEAKTAAIYKSSMAGEGNWSIPEKLGKDINVEGYTSKQPMLTLDGKYLMYVSNKPGGQGGFDIWYASVEGGNLANSKNAGVPVNTSDNEITPFYHAPSKSLVFANEGRVGLGGYDLFYAKGDFENGFAEPKNMGYPVNSTKNDEYFFNDDEKFLMKNFYLSSDRESDCCLELFNANKVIKKWVKGRVVDSKTGQPLSDVVVNITDDKGNKIPSTRTDKEGNYFFESNPYNHLNANANKDNYETAATRIEGDFNIDTLARADWAMTPIPPPPPPIITAEKPLIVRFEFNKSDITPEFSVYLDTLAAMMSRDKEMMVEIGGYTDKIGTDEYNLDLSQKRADAAKAYMVEKYGTEEGRFTTKGYGECCPIENEKDEKGRDNAAARKMNRRLEFKLKKKGE